MSRRGDLVVRDPHALTAPDILALRSDVRRWLELWEREDGAGSARPVFEVAWTRALARNLLTGRPTPHDREREWRHWLEEGGRSTTGSRVDTLRTIVARRQTPEEPKRHTLADYIGPAREPGEEG